MALLFSIADLTSISAVTRCDPAKARVCGKTKEREAKVLRVSDPVREGRAVSPMLSGSLLCVSLPPPPSPSLKEQQKEGGDDKQKYYVNMGYAIRTLREDFPVIFYRKPSFDIYREDIVFKDPFNTFMGIRNYKRIFWALRTCGQMFFKALNVDVVSVWQPVENVIMIRWTVHGVPRVPWESRGRFDGTSQYKLDRDGKIFEHRVDNIAVNPSPKFRVVAVEELIQALGCPSTPRPTYFETLSAQAKSCLSFTWVRCYLALHHILASRPSADG